jgi:hypothetical protein
MGLEMRLIRSFITLAAICLMASLAPVVSLAAPPLAPMAQS